MISEEEWKKINDAIAIDGDGKATGLYYAPEMVCENCGKKTDRNTMVWVRVRTYEDSFYGKRSTHEKWCNPCYEN